MAESFLALPDQVTVFVVVVSMKMDSVIVRQARNDFEALQVSNAMQSLTDVEVISIVFRTMLTYEVWYVFAKYDSEYVKPDDIDDAIDAAFKEK